MVETAGTKLRRARQLRQLSIEDASRATRIRVRQIADLEADEYSNFANLAYAKSFLVAYGKYLAVDTRPYMDAFADASTFGMDDYQYLSDRPVGVYRSTRRMPRQRVPRRKRFVTASATVGILTILLFGRLAYNTVQRLGDLDKLAARRAARAHVSQPGKPDSPDTVSNAATPASEGAPAAMPVSATPVPNSTPTDTDSARLAASSASPVELPALAAVPVPEAVEAAVPAVPLPGDGAAVRGLLTAPTAQRPAFDPLPVFRADEPQPQKVVNNGPRLPVN